MRSTTSVSGGSSSTGSTPTAESNDPYARKWRAFAAIGVSMTTMVMSMSMVFVALPSIADEFEITLREVGWVVIIQALTISSLMLPMGRVADLIGRRRMHLMGLAVFAIGAALVAAAPTFPLLIAARVVMAAGNAMGQSVGTAMVVTVFPAAERGKAIGSQTTAVAIGGASGPILGGLILQVLSWRMLFLLLVIPIAVAFVMGVRILDENQVTPEAPDQRPAFDRGGAVLSALAIILTVIVINNPVGLAWGSPLMLGGLLAMAVLAAAFIWWEGRVSSPMLRLDLFANRVFQRAVLARWIGFMGSTVSFFLVPVFLISLRGLDPATAGGVLFLNSLGMGMAAQGSGRLSDRFGARRFSLVGFALMTAASLSFSTMTGSTALWFVMVTLLFNGVALGLWNVPNNSAIIGAAPVADLGVVGALTNLVRNVGNVTGQALASSVVAAVMLSRGFDVPLSELGDSAGAGDGFVAGWQVVFLLVAVLSLLGLVATAGTGPPRKTSPPVGQHEAVQAAG